MFEKLFKRQVRETPKAAESAEAMVPPYFSEERCADLGKTFARIGLDVKGIQNID